MTIDFSAVAPLLALTVGALTVLLLDLLLPPKRGQAWWFLATLASIGVSFYYVSRLWPLPAMASFSGALVVDRFGLIFSVVILGTLFLTALLSTTRTEADKSGYLALLLFAGAGMLLLTSAGSLMTIFLGLELLSLALFVLIAFDPRRPRAREAALNYFVLGSVAGALLLFGFAFLYGATGSVTLTGIAAAVDVSSWYYKVGLALSLVGFLFKLALVPFHIWAPDVYAGAPTPVTAFMAVGSKAAGLAAMARFVLMVVPADTPSLLVPIWVLAAASMLLGGIGAMKQVELKRLLAYSGIAHAGYLVMGLAGFGPEGVGAAAYYLLVYLFMNFGVFALLLWLPEGEQLESWNGLFTLRPGLAILMSLFMFSLAGLPPTGGFIGKLLLLLVAAGGRSWLLIGALAVSTGFSAYAYLRVIARMMAPPVAGMQLAVAPAGLAAEEPKPEVVGSPEPELLLPKQTVSLALGFTIFVSALGTLLLGVLPQFYVQLTQALEMFQ